MRQTRAEIKRVRCDARTALTRIISRRLHLRGRLDRPRRQEHQPMLLRIEFTVLLAAYLLFLADIIGVI